MKKILLLIFMACGIVCSGFDNFDTNTQENIGMSQKETKEMEDSNQINLDISSPSVYLLELQSGRVLYEKDSETPRKPASVTKLMAMLLCFENLEKGKICKDQIVHISEHAASMGGSQVYLEPGEEQSIQDLLKCMIVSSANDAAVALGETIAGSEEAFVEMMNQKAKQLGMEQTHYENVCGLEVSGHEMSAKDIGILSRYLILHYPQVFDYTTIWMDEITHNTKKGSSIFGLANTNKFLKKYEGANGLKTGYTSVAGFSMSATATRDGMTLIAVVMGAKTKEERYSDAQKLLDYGFANCKLYHDGKVLDGKDYLSITGGEKKKIHVCPKQEFQYAFIGDFQKNEIKKEMKLIKESAPVNKGDTVAKILYYYNNKNIGEVEIIAAENVKKEKYKDSLEEIVLHYVNIAQ